MTLPMICQHGVLLTRRCTACAVPSPLEECEHGVPIAEHCRICDVDECDPLPRFGGVSPDDMLAEPSGDGHRLAVWLLLALAGAIVGVLIATRSP